MRSGSRAPGLSSQGVSSGMMVTATMNEAASATIRLTDSEPTAGTGPDPDALEAQAAEVAEQERQLLAELEQARERLNVARAELAEKERAATEAERAHLAAVRADEAIILCPANHSPPLIVSPHPGVPGYEAVATCLAPPDVRARTEGVIAFRPPAA